MLFRAGVPNRNEELQRLLRGMEKLEEAGLRQGKVNIGEGNGERLMK